MFDELNEINEMIFSRVSYLLIKVGTSDGKKSSGKTIHIHTYCVTCVPKTKKSHDSILNPSTFAFLNHVQGTYNANFHVMDLTDFFWSHVNHLFYFRRDSFNL